MSFPSKCELCEHETKDIEYRCGPDTFGKTKSRYVCRNYECSAFSKAHLYAGDSIPEKKIEVPDMEFSAEDEQDLFEAEPKKQETAKKKTTRKKVDK